MDILSVQDKLDVASELLDAESQYAFSPIDFVLVKNRKGVEDYIIGFHDEIEEYVLKPLSKKHIINADNIKYTNQYRNIYKECLEGYILTKMNDGYQLFYMTLETHCKLWRFIDLHNEDLEIIMNGTYQYLRFCHETGIAHKTLEYFLTQEIPDINRLLVDNKFHDYNILLSETIGEKRVILGFQERLSLRKMGFSFVFKVFVIDNNSLKIEYEDMHEKIENAFTDYTTRFFGLSFSYYKEKEISNQKILEQFKQLMKESIV